MIFLKVKANTLVLSIKKISLNRLNLTFMIKRVFYQKRSQ